MTANNTHFFLKQSIQLFSGYVRFSQTGQVLPGSASDGTAQHEVKQDEGSGHSDTHKTRFVVRVSYTNRHIDLLPYLKERDRQLSELEHKLRENGYDVKVFRMATLDDVLDAIVNNKIIERTNITERMQEPNFRFVTAFDPDHSLKVSHALSAFLKHYKSHEASRASVSGVKQRQSNADEFAINMYHIVEAIKEEQQISSYRDVVQALNEAKIDTYQKQDSKGGRRSWHLSTLQKLTKRWQELGLTG
ncbi:hypothetical protein [uncultured Fibrella sp.]|uniref:hypothetical protein n=1 Tax=uncultured Fibrella sp. TaxID=1284596 RepID=UPI0035CAEEB7